MEEQEEKKTKEKETIEEAKVEEKMPEEKIEEQAEEKVEERVEAAVEEKVEEKVEEPKAKVEEKVKETPKEEKQEAKEEPKQEDEYMAMLKEDEKEKKAKQEAKEEDEPEEEKDIAKELSLIKIKGKRTKKEVEKEQKVEEKLQEETKVEEEKQEEIEAGIGDPTIYALRTTANREDQVMDFVGSNAARKKLEVYSIIRPHGMRGYIFLEAGSRSDAEQAAFGVPYARGLLPNVIQYNEIEHMLEQIKKEVNIQKNDIAEIISGPFKREKCKITRIDRAKEEVVVELLEAAVPIPITVKMDAVRVIRRETDEE